MNCLYFSETSLKQLGILRDDFPILNFSDPTVENSKKCCIGDGASSCLEHGLTMDRPEKIPFEPKEENIHKLEAWLLEVMIAHIEYYKLWQ